jgi:hypothetical protein
MRWVLIGAVSPAVPEALVRHEHTSQPMSALELPPEAAPREIIQAAQAKQLDLLTTDAALVNAVFDQDIWFNRVIVFLQLDGGDIEQDDAIDRLFRRYKRLTPTRLYTVTGSRVKIRQLPGRT